MILIEDSSKLYTNMEVDLGKLLIMIGIQRSGVIVQRPHVHGACRQMCVLHGLIAETLSPRGQGVAEAVSLLNINKLMRGMRKEKTF